MAKGKKDYRHDGGLFGTLTGQHVLDIFLSPWLYYVIGITAITGGIGIMTGDNCGNMDGDYTRFDNRGGLFSTGPCLSGFEENEDGICCHKQNPLGGFFSLLIGIFILRVTYYFHLIAPYELRNQKKPKKERIVPTPQEMAQHKAETKALHEEERREVERRYEEMGFPYHKMKKNK